MDTKCINRRTAGSQLGSHFCCLCESFSGVNLWTCWRLFISCHVQSCLWTILLSGEKLLLMCQHVWFNTVCAMISCHKNLFATQCFRAIFVDSGPFIHNASWHCLPRWLALPVIIVIMYPKASTVLMCTSFNPFTQILGPIAFTFDYRITWNYCLTAPKKMKLFSSRRMSSCNKEFHRSNTISNQKLKLTNLIVNVSWWHGAASFCQQIRPLAISTIQ